MTLTIEARDVVRWCVGIVSAAGGLVALNRPAAVTAALNVVKVPGQATMLLAGTTVLPWIALLSGLLLVAGMWRRAAALWVSILGVLLVVLAHVAWKGGMALLVPGVSNRTAFLSAIILLLGGLWVLWAPRGTAASRPTG